MTQVIILIVFGICLSPMLRCTSLPVSGSGDISTEYIDCFIPQTNETNLSELKAGIMVVQKYTELIVSRIEAKVLFQLYGVCTPPVEYKTAETSTLSNSAVTADNIAKWYAVFVGIESHLNAIQPSSQSDELDTMKTLITALKQSYFNVLQDLSCNCSADCQIPILEPNDIGSCPAPLISVELFYQVIAPLARSTVSQFSESCGCQSPGVQTTGIEWFQAHFPSNDPDFSEMVDELTPNY